MSPHFIDLSSSLGEDIQKLSLLFPFYDHRGKIKGFETGRDVQGRQPTKSKTLLTYRHGAYIHLNNYAQY